MQIIQYTLNIYILRMISRKNLFTLIKINITAIKKKKYIYIYIFVCPKIFIANRFSFWNKYDFDFFFF